MGRTLLRYRRRLCRGRLLREENGSFPVCRLACRHSSCAYSPAQGPILLNHFYQEFVFAFLLLLIETIFKCFVLPGLTFSPCSDRGDRRSCSFWYPARRAQSYPRD